MAYTVKAGDSLWQIAQSLLGDGSRWPELKAANGLSGTTIQAGQVLNIPGESPPPTLSAPTQLSGVPIGPAAFKEAMEEIGVDWNDPAYRPTGDYGAPGSRTAAQQAGLMAELGDILNRAQNLPSPTVDIMQDPAYVAFLSSMGLQESDIQGNLALARQGYQQRYQEALPGYEDARKTSTRNIGLNHENRGMYKSGVRLRDQAESAARIDSQQASALGHMTRGIAEQERQASSSSNELRRRNALEEILARERLSQRDLNALGAPI